jgi:hypothetical protein
VLLPEMKPENYEEVADCKARGAWFLHQVRLFMSNPLCVCLFMSNPQGSSSHYTPDSKPAHPPPTNNSTPWTWASRTSSASPPSPRSSAGPAWPPTPRPTPTSTRSCASAASRACPAPPSTWPRSRTWASSRTTSRRASSSSRYAPFVFFFGLVLVFVHFRA